MTATPGIFEVLASDQHDARVASRRALVLSRDRLDARLGKFLAASRSPEEFDARYDLVSDDFAGIVRVAADEVGHDDPDSLIETLHAHYREAKDHWIQDAVKKPGDLHKKLDVPEGEKISEDKIENAEETGDKNLKEKAQFAENVKGLGKGKKSSTVAGYLSSYYASDNDEDEEETEDDPDAFTLGADGTPDLVQPQRPKKKSSTQKKSKKCAECKDKNHNSCAGGDCSCKKCSGDDDDSLEFAAKTADAAPFVQAALVEPASGSGEDNLTEYERQLIQAGRAKIGPNGILQLINPDMHTPPEKQAKTAAPEGNTGLAGPSPKMDKKRWTPKSVKPIDVPSERHPTVQKDILEVMPKENEGPPGDVSKIDEINALTTTETLPTATGLDDSGFNTDKNTGDSGPTKTWGTDGCEAEPVGSGALES
jgi:hypothetical protein